jgi:hypothetical protein
VNKARLRHGSSFNTIEREVSVATQSNLSRAVPVEGLLRRSVNHSLAYKKNSLFAGKRKATTGIEPVFTALQRVDFRSSELFAGVFSSVRCSEFCSVL